jgi:hypothetical protein
MSHNFTENRSGPRYVAYFPVRAEWDDEESGAHVIAEGQTENVGPSGALVHLERLPRVGGRVQLAVLEDEDDAGAARAEKLRTVAEVLRVERNPAQPLAALQLVNATDEWRGLVYAPASTWERDHTQIEYEDD